MSVNFSLVYESNAGHTYRYAEYLSERLEVPAYSLDQAKRKLPRGSKVVFLGWIFASTVKGAKKALQRFDVLAVIGCGMGPTGSQLDQIRQQTGVPDRIPVFSVQGGMELSKLSGPYKLALSMAAKAAQKAGEAPGGQSDEDRQMLELFQNPRDCVSQHNVDLLLTWLDQQLDLGLSSQIPLSRSSEYREADALRDPGALRGNEAWSAPAQMLLTPMG